MFGVNAFMKLNNKSIEMYMVRSNKKTKWTSKKTVLY